MKFILTWFYNYNIHMTSSSPVNERLTTQAAQTLNTINT